MSHVARKPQSDQTCKAVRSPVVCSSVCLLPSCNAWGPPALASGELAVCARKVAQSNWMLSTRTEYASRGPGLRCDSLWQRLWQPLTLLSDVLSQAAPTDTGCRSSESGSVIVAKAAFDAFAAQCGQSAAGIAGMASAREPQLSCEETIRILQTEVEQIRARLRSNENASAASLKALEESVEALCQDCGRTPVTAKPFWI